LAYAAGLVDGEGHIGLTHWGSSFLPVLTVTNTDARCGEWLIAHFGGQVFRHDSATRSHRTKFNWRLNGKRATTVLEAVLPYLVLKCEQAEIAISYYAGQESFHLGDRKLPAVEYERRKQLHLQLKALHHAEQIQLILPLLDRQ
jgi:hypothetical protein